ncbi:MAG: BLUF domain-containing protein [Gammaproteobacteria bacterium]|nr:BLUF domain-containing protein [Gammaproteobacteria bacterium]
MHLLMYTSQYTGEIDDIPKHFRDILVASRQNNPKLNITGVLFFDDGHFIQILEGEKDALHELMEKIRLNPIHKNLNVLIDSPIEQRELADWNMKAFNFPNELHKDWQVLQDLRDAYLENFKISTKQIIGWLKHFIEDYANFRHLEH